MEREPEKKKGFEDLDVWKKSIRLTLDIYSELTDLRDYGFRDQIRRAAVSIPSNIAEGYERQTNKELVQFLYIAKGSCSELQTQLYLANSLNYINKTKGEELINEAKAISKMLNSLINYRKGLI